MAEPARCTAALAVHGGKVQRVHASNPHPCHGLALPPTAGLANCLYSQMWLMVMITCTWTASQESRAGPATAAGGGAAAPCPHTRRHGRHAAPRPFAPTQPCACRQCTHATGDARSVRLQLQSTSSSTGSSCATITAHSPQHHGRPGPPPAATQLQLPLGSAALGVLHTTWFSYSLRSERKTYLNCWHANRCWPLNTSCYRHLRRPRGRLMLHATGGCRSRPSCSRHCAGRAAGCCNPLPSPAVQIQLQSPLRRPHSSSR